MTGPSLAALMAHLADASPDLLDPGIYAAAVVADTLVDTCGVVLDVRAFADVDESAQAQAAAALACWLVRSPAVRSAWAQAPAGPPSLSPADRVLAAVRVLVGDLAPVVPPRRWIEDAAGREEAARAFLRAVGLRPAGESEAVAADRWAAISTAGRRAAEREMAAEARWAKELARRLADRRAKEAVAQYTQV